MIGRAGAKKIESELHKAIIEIGMLCCDLETENVLVLATLVEDLSEMRSRRLAAAHLVEEKIKAANEAIHEYLRYDPIWVCDSEMKMIGFRPGTPEGLTHLEDCMLLSTAMVMSPINPDFFIPAIRLESRAVAIKRIRLGGEFLERQGRPKIAALMAREDVKEAFDLVLAEDAARRLS